MGDEGGGVQLPPLRQLRPCDPRYPPRQEAGEGTKGRGAYGRTSWRFQLAKCGGPGGTRCVDARLSHVQRLRLPVRAGPGGAGRVPPTGHGGPHAERPGVLRGRATPASCTATRTPGATANRVGGCVRASDPRGWSWIGAARGGSTSRAWHRSASTSGPCRSSCRDRGSCRRLCTRRAPSPKPCTSSRKIPAAALTRWRIATGERAGVTGGHRPVLENWGEARAAMEVTDDTARYMDEVVRGADDPGVGRVLARFKRSRSLAVATIGGGERQTFEPGNTVTCLTGRRMLLVRMP